MKKGILFSLVVILSFSVQTSFANVWIVNNAGPGDFTDAQDAIDAAAANDTLYFVGSAQSYGYLYLEKPLTLIATGYYLELNPNTNQNKVPVQVSAIYIYPENGDTGVSPRNFDGGAAGSHIMGFDTYIQVYVNNVTIERFRGYITGYDDNEGTLPSGLVAKRCFFTYYVSNFNNASLENCIFDNNYYPYNMDNTMVRHCNLYAPSTSEVPNCVFINCIFTGGSQILNLQDPNNVRHCVFQAANPDAPDTNPNYTPGVNNLFSVTPIFVTGATSPDSEYVLDPASPAVGAGEDGSDCGAFGGLTPYVLSGIPPIPAVYEITAPNAVNAPDGLPVTIKVKANN